MDKTNPVSLLDYLLRYSVSVRQCLDLLGRYQPLETGAKGPILTQYAGRAIFGCELPAHLVELQVVDWLVRVRRATGVELQPLEVHLQTPGRANEDCERVFECPVRYSAATTCLVFDSTVLETPGAQSDPNLLAWLCRIADERLRELNVASSFAGRVRAAMQALGAENRCNIEDVAARLAISPRTLQRRLGNEDTSFAAVQDDLRRASALQALRNPAVAIKDAAYRAGFSEPSTFYRAFRRWTGATPADYRRKLHTSLAA